MRKLVIIAVSLFLLLNMSILNAAQSVRGYRGLFELVSPYTLDKRISAISFSVNNIDLKDGDVDVNRFYFNFAHGITNNLEVVAGLSYNRVKKVDLLDINFEYPFADSWQDSLGYALVGLKFNIVKTESFSLGILGEANINLSSKSKGVTTSKPYFLTEVLMAYKTGSLTLTSNLGYCFVSDPDEIDLPNSFNYGVGAEIAINEKFSIAGQIVGKSYSGGEEGIEQQNPVNAIIGLKYEKEKFGVSLAYKKNLAFSQKDLKDSHGAVGSVWVYLGEKEKPVIENKLESVQIQGDQEVFEDDTRSYQSLILPENATKPFTYIWEVSDNGEIVSGQNSPTLSVKWNKESKDSFVRLQVTNNCSSVKADLGVVVKKRILPAKKEFFFSIDSSELSMASKKDLDITVNYLKYHPDLKIQIQGHTCSIATEEYNLALGEHRAEAVKQYLVSNGISEDRIKVVSYGESNPAYDNSAEDTRKKNRRVFLPIENN